MSQVSGFLTKYLGIPEINLLHPTAATLPAIAQTVATVSSASSAKSLMTPIVTAAGTVIAEIEPTVIAKLEAAVNALLVKAGAASSVPDADALISAELSKLV